MVVGTGCFGIKIETETAKFMNVTTEQCVYLVRESEMFDYPSKMKLTLRAEWVVLRVQFCILASCCLSPMTRNSVLEELRVSRFAVSHDIRH